MGLGDFFNGVADSTVDIVTGAPGAIKNVAKGVAFAADPGHWDDIGRGAVKAGEVVGEHIGDMAKGVGWLATHPSYWDDAAKKMVIDQFTDPVNIATNVAMLGLTVATAGGAAPAWMAKMGLGTVEAAETAATVGKGVEAASSAAKGVEAAEGIAKGAEAAAEGGRISKFAESARNIKTGISEAKGFGKVGEFLDAPTNLLKAGRRDLLGVNELGYVQRGRNALAEGLFPSVGEGEANWASRAAFRKVAGGPGLSTEGAQTLGSTVKTRVGQFEKAVGSPQAFGQKAHTWANLTQIASNPEKAALGYAKQHKGDILEFAGKHAGDQIVSTVKNKIFGHDDDKEPGAPEVPETPAMGQQFTDWQRSDTGMVSQPRQSSFDVGDVTTTTQTDTSQIGPSKWYGQSGYGTGRGFQSPASQQQWGTTPWSQDPAFA